MAKNKRIQMTEELFNNVKRLLEVGVTPTMIVKLGTGSPATIWRVKQVKDYEAYKALIEASHKKEQAKRAKVAALVVAPVAPEEIEDPKKEAPVQADANWDIVKDLFTIVQDQSDIIKRMDQSLTWLAEHAVIQSVNTKRRFF